MAEEHEHVFTVSTRTCDCGATLSKEEFMAAIRTEQRLPTTLNAARDEIIHYRAAFEKIGDIVFDTLAEYDRNSDALALVSLRKIRDIVG